MSRTVFHLASSIPQREKVLQIKVERQHNERSCWAYTVSAISRFLDPESRWTPCRLASFLFEDDCCSSRMFGGCDNVYLVSDAMRSVTGNLRDFRGGPISFDEIVQEIDCGLPIAIRLDWSPYDDLLHSIIIKGYGCSRRGENTVIVADPIYGDGQYEMRQLERGYYHTGLVSWVGTCLTKRPFAS